MCCPFHKTQTLPSIYSVYVYNEQLLTNSVYEWRWVLLILLVVDLLYSISY